MRISPAKTNLAPKYGETPFHRGAAVSALKTFCAKMLVAAQNYARTFRLKTFGLIVAGGYATGNEVATAVHVSPNAQSKVATAFALVAGLCYCLTPNRPDAEASAGETLKKSETKNEQ